MESTRMWVRLALASVAVALMATGVYWSAHSQPPESESHDVELAQFAEHEDVRAQNLDLDARQQAALGRVNEKRTIAAALVRGELNLQQAAERFRQINGDDPYALAALRRYHPGATDAELLYRSVIGFVWGVLAEHPDGPHGVVARLEAELTQKFPQRPAPLAERPPG